MSEDRDPRTRSRLLAVAVLVSVFMAGGLTAAAVIQVMRAGDSPDPPSQAFERPARGPRSGMGPGAMRGGGPGGPGLAPMVMSRRMADRLGLSQDQQDRVHEILERHHQASDSIMRQVFPRLRDHLETARSQIREVLTDEQRERFDLWTRESREGLFRRFPGGP